MSAYTKGYNELPFDEKEVLRYAGCKPPDEQTSSLLNECWEEVREKLIYQLCYKEVMLSFDGEGCFLDGVFVKSKKLKGSLSECNKAIVFCATVGVELDRCIGKYSRLSPSKAVMMQAIGAERVETLCNRFCEELKEKHGKTTARFSPGYGDLAMQAQKIFFSLLQPEKYIGVYLNDSLLMSPTKSVTAIVGI